MAENCEVVYLAVKARLRITCSSPREKFAHVCFRLMNFITSDV